MANTFNWQLGHEGKGSVYPNGDISTWNVNQSAEPHHDEVADQQNQEFPHFYFYLTPEGGLHHGGLGFKNNTPFSDDQMVQEIVAQHPAVYDGRLTAEDLNLAPRVEKPEGGFGHAYNLLDVMSKLGVNENGWSDFHTELKLPRDIRKKIRRWVDRLEWPEGHEKEDARRYHITILSMDEYDEDFAKWARKEIQGRVFSFKTKGLDIFGGEHVVLGMECPEWTELVKEWQEVADKKGLEPRKFDPPKAHVTLGKSPEGKWPQGIPNPHLKFDTRRFNINKNSDYDFDPQRWRDAFDKEVEYGPGDQAEMVPTQSMLPYLEYDRPMFYNDEGFQGQYHRDLRDHIQQHGIGGSLKLEHNPKTGVAWLGEGNHRLKIAEELGISHVPVEVLTTNGGPDKYEGLTGEPLPNPPQPDQNGYIPSRLKPSEVGLPTTGGINKSSVVLNEHGRPEEDWDYGRPWEPGSWGKGFLDRDDQPVIWQTSSPKETMRPIHYDYAEWLKLQKEDEGESPDDAWQDPENMPIAIAPNGEYSLAPDWAHRGIYRDDELLGSFGKLHPNLTMITPEQWSNIYSPKETGGYGHGKNVMDILNKQSMAVDPKWHQQWTEANPYLYHGRYENADSVRQRGIDGSFGSYYPTPSVYLTDQPELAAHFALDPGIEPEYGDETQQEIGRNVYKIDARKLDPKLIDSDEWNTEYPEDVQYHGEDLSVTPELEQHVSDPATVHHQWERGYPLAYRGAIPPEAIVDHWPVEESAGFQGRGARNAAADASGVFNPPQGSNPVLELQQWFDSFTPKERQPPSLHHTDGDDFMPQVVAPVVQTPHIDPPSKPYEPYNWAEEGWEESPLDRVSGDMGFRQLELGEHHCPECFSTAIADGGTYNECLNCGHIEPKDNPSFRPPRPSDTPSASELSRPVLFASQEHKGAADPEWLNRWMEINGPYLFHYTHPDHLEDIKRHGIIPWDAPLENAPGSGWQHGTLQPRPGHTYLSTRPEVEPDQYSRSGQVVIDARKLDPSRFMPDEDAGVSGVLHWKKLPGYEDLQYPENIESAEFPRGDWAEEHNLRHPEMVQESLNRNGTVAYHGAIPPEAIAEVRSPLEEPNAPYAPSYIKGMPQSVASIDTHVCPKCGEDSDSPICATCGYDPQNSPDDYQQMKTDWYDRAWSVPGDQPQPTPHELHPQHWRDDHAKNISLARKETNGCNSSNRWSISDKSSTWGPTDDMSTLRNGESSSLQIDPQKGPSSVSTLQHSVSGASSLGGWHGF